MKILLIKFLINVIEKYDDPKRTEINLLFYNQGIFLRHLFLFNIY